jgi:hypothetical protein
MGSRSGTFVEVEYERPVIESKSAIERYLHAPSDEPTGAGLVEGAAVDPLVPAPPPFVPLPSEEAGAQPASDATIAMDARAEKIVTGRRFTVDILVLGVWISTLRKRRNTCVTAARIEPLAGVRSDHRRADIVSHTCRGFTTALPDPSGSSPGGISPERKRTPRQMLGDFTHRLSDRVQLKELAAVGYWGVAGIFPTGPHQQCRRANDDQEDCPPTDEHANC